MSAPITTMEETAQPFKPADIPLATILVNATNKMAVVLHPTFALHLQMAQNGNTKARDNVRAVAEVTRLQVQYLEAQIGIAPDPTLNPQKVDALKTWYALFTTLLDDTRLDGKALLEKLRGLRALLKKEAPGLEAN